MQEVGDFFGPVAHAQGRTLEISTVPDAIVRGSPKLLKRALINLVDNSFRHTRPGGRIAVEVLKHHGRVRLVVSDEGPGFEVRDGANLFRRFARGASDHAGAGLGLALCHEIVRKHHGRIEILTAPETGTTAMFEVPASPPTVAG